MDSRTTPFFLSFPLGTWFETRIRVSLFFLFVLIYCILEHQPAVGVVVFAVLFFSVLIHEFGHVFAARSTGGEGEDILMWPLGGLAYVRPANTTSSEIVTSAAGPFTNLVLSVLSLAALWYSGRAITGDIFSLFMLPPIPWETDRLGSVLLVIASINFKLLCVNLLPALPLDGGHIAYAIARTQGDAPEMRQFVVWLGMAVSIGLVVLGTFADETLPVVLAFFVAVLNLQEYFILALTDQWSDGFVGADLRNSLRDDEETERRPGMIARWRQRRAEERQMREEEERIETERRVDALLAKVHREGMQSLTEEEKRFLNRASQRYRSQEH